MRKKKKKSFSLFRKPAKRKKRWTGLLRKRLLIALKVLIVVGVLASVGFGFLFLEGYVEHRSELSKKSVPLELINVPDWANEALRNKIYTAASSYGEDLKIDENVARSVQGNLESQVGWLDNITVQAANDRLVVLAKWRKPLAMVKAGINKWYVDVELVVLDYIEMSNLPIVKVDGLFLPSKPPLSGDKLDLDDLAAAIAILAGLDKMDASVTLDKPLLYEIDRIDMSNFGGRENSRYPHVILYTKDNTEIIWGAEFGTWQRYLEAPDEEKLAKLYHYYKENDFSLNGVRYINLRYSQNQISQPVDKY